MDREIMGISLVVATVGRTEELRRLLQSLASQTVKDFEVILVDQNDDDRLHDIVTEFLARGLCLRHVEQKERNVSAARNSGLRLATRQFVGFPDDDCWYECDVVERVLLACGQDRGVDGVVGRWIERGLPIAGSRTLSWRLMREFREVETNSIEIFLRRDLVLAIGGFDEDLGVSGWFGSGEETDLVMRVLRDGGRMVYVPQIEVHHPWVAEMPGTIKQRWARSRSRGRGTGALYAKHRLSPVVVARGLIAPIVKCLLPPYGSRHIVTQLAMVIGRCEGFLRWRFQPPAR
jgi:glycosyltransferase involved in cell wall biosynthesis